MRRIEFPKASDAVSWIKASLAWRQPLHAAVLAFALAACGGGDGGRNEATEPAGTPPAGNAAAVPLVLSEAVAPGDPNCKAGGTKFFVGQDADGNGTLNDGEATVSYACNSETAQAMGWVGVTEPFVQALSNTGYAAMSEAQVTIRLPAAPVPNDVVRVSGLGSGGWKIEPNAGQFIVVDELPISWKTHQDAHQWASIASSGDGQSLLAVVQWAGQIHVSRNAGDTWTMKKLGLDELPNEQDGDDWWIELRAVASSAMGEVFAVAGAKGEWVQIDDVNLDPREKYFVLISRDGGDWTVKEAPALFNSVALSAAGDRLVASSAGTGKVYTSDDDGQSWDEHQPGGFDQSWVSVASSDSGDELVAAAAFGQIYASPDHGETWFGNPHTDGKNWAAVASASATQGRKLVAVERNGHIHTSDDGGATWTPRGPGLDWTSVASSADGKHLAAVAAGSFVHTSSDGGQTWVPREDVEHEWLGIASSADGTRLAAFEDGGPIRTSVTLRTTSAEGWLGGSQYQAVDLLYVGEGAFMPTITSNPAGGGFAVH